MSILSVILWAILWPATMTLAAVIGFWWGRDTRPSDQAPRPAPLAPRHAAVIPRQHPRTPRPRLRLERLLWLQRDHTPPGPIRINLAHQRPPTAELIRLCHQSDELWERLVPRETTSPQALAAAGNPKENA